MLCVRWGTRTRRQWQRQKTISSSYPKAPVQESKQLFPQLHKPLHLYVNMSEFVILIVPYFALGKRYTYKHICVCIYIHICISIYTYVYTHIQKVICLEWGKSDYSYLLFIFFFYYSLYFSLWPKMLLHWHLLPHILSFLQRPIETGLLLLFSLVLVYLW